MCHGGEQTLHGETQLKTLGFNETSHNSQTQLLSVANKQRVHLLALLDNNDPKPQSISRDAGWYWADLREFLAAHNPKEFQHHAQAVQYYYWLREHQYCGICGNPTELNDNQSALHCPTCNKSWFPRIQPCVITLIHNGDRILLAKHRNYTTNTYSCIAGFAESGENLEQALKREVKEEVGVQVHNLTYFGSQAWPFPYQLMMGFYAEYLDGDIVIDNEEIVDAKWWHISQLPDYPPATSIAGQLIEHYVSNPRP